MRSRPGHRLAVVFDQTCAGACACARARLRRWRALPAGSTSGDTRAPRQAELLDNLSTVGGNLSSRRSGERARIDA